MAARVVVNQAAIEQIAHSPGMRSVLQRVGEGVEANAERLAPKGRTRGRSAQRGLFTVMVRTPDGWEARVGHVKRAFGWHLARVEWGTRKARPHPHLRPAARMPVEVD